MRIFKFMLCVLLFVSVFHTNNTVNAATKDPFSDPNLYLYSSDDTYQVKKGEMYIKNHKGKFLLHSEKYISNKKLLNVTKSLLDKERYTYVSYTSANNDKKVERVHVTFATSSMAARYGVTPISYYFNINRKVKTEGIKNVRIGLFLDYQFYDVKTDKLNSPIFKKKLKNSLVELFGKNDGDKIYTYVNNTRYKYYKKPVKQYTVVKSSKKIGKYNVNCLMMDNGMYVSFSY